jgi:hypothetical protein
MIRIKKLAATNQHWHIILFLIIVHGSGVPSLFSPTTHTSIIIMCGTIPFLTTPAAKNLPADIGYDKHLQIAPCLLGHDQRPASQAWVP